MDHTKELIELAHLGNKEARDFLVLQNMGLVYSVAKRFFNRGYDMEDITQIGTIGLIKAIDKFDLTQPVMFSTYAVPMISGEIKRFIRDDGMIKVSRSIKENGWKIHQACEVITQKYGREATLEELVELTGIPKEDIVMALDASKEVESIYQTAYQGDGNTVFIVDKLSATTQISPNDSVINKMMIKQLIDNLSDMEKDIIRMRYYEDKTQTQVAQKLGISQVQVSRMEKKILFRMRKEAEE
jgi:RNA polymerase sporulation-specific sigma factor